MITPIASIAPLRRPGRPGRRALTCCVPLLAAGALAAGCGTAHVGAGSGGSPSSGGTPTAAPSSGANGPAAPPASATPVPTVSGGHVVAGGPACVDWPANAPTASLPVSFVPVSVERCVSGAQVIAGKGVWTTATLQRADSGLAALISALEQPLSTHRTGAACPALATILPAVVLINSAGQELIPRLPATGCALTESGVMAALNGLRWQPVSVRLIARIPGAGTPAASPSAAGSAPGGGGVQTR